MAKKKKPTKKSSVAETLKAVRKLKPGFEVIAVTPASSRSGNDVTARSRSGRTSQAVQTPDLGTLKRKYGLTSTTDAVPNGVDATVDVPKTTAGTNQVFELRSRNAGADKPSQSKTLIVSRYSKKAVSAQG